MLRLDEVDQYLLGRSSSAAKSRPPSRSRWPAATRQPPSSTALISAISSLVFRAAHRCRPRPGAPTFAQRLRGRDAQHGRNRPDRCRLVRVIRPRLHHHPHRALTQLRGVLRGTCHVSDPSNEYSPPTSGRLRRVRVDQHPRPPRRRPWRRTDAGVVPISSASTHPARCSRPIERAATVSPVTSRGLSRRRSGTTTPTAAMTSSPLNTGTAIEHAPSVISSRVVA